MTITTQSGLARDLAFSATYEEEISWRRLEMTISLQSGGRQVSTDIAGNVFCPTHAPGTFTRSESPTIKPIVVGTFVALLNTKRLCISRVS